MLKSVIKPGCKGSVKGMAFDLNSGDMFISCYDNKTIYYYKLLDLDKTVWPFTPNFLVGKQEQSYLYVQGGPESEGYGVLAVQG